jgi:hypothetical protein
MPDRRPDQAMGHAIRVENVTAQVAHHRGHGALAAGDSAVNPTRSISGGGAGAGRTAAAAPP